MRSFIILFSIIIFFWNCNLKKEKGDFFLDYLKESRLVENAYHDEANIADSLQYTQIEYFEDSILTKAFRHGYVRCELYKTNQLFHDNIYHIGIVYPPILPHSGYIIAFDKNGKYLYKEEVSGKYHLDIEFKSITGHPKIFLMISHGDGGAGTYHDMTSIYTISNNEITLLYEYHRKYESWYDPTNILEDTLISFSYYPELNQILMINEISKGKDTDDTLKQYQDTTIILPKTLLIKQ